jgi:hypothetical protein
MLTGTPLDLTSFGVLFQAIGIIYWIAFFGLLYLAIKKPITRTRKAVWTLVVLAVFLGGPGHNGWNNYQAQQRYQAAKAHFDERCKEAGERILKTVSGEKIIRLVNIRPDKHPSSDQFALDDPYGYTEGGEDYIKRYLVGSLRKPGLVNEAKSLNDITWYEKVEVPSKAGGFDVYTTSLDPLTGMKILFLGGGVVPLRKEHVKISVANFGIEWVDISTPEDRKHWIAGGSLRIVDLRSKIVIAERTGFLFDTGLGNTDGFRRPWNWAQSDGKACPRWQDHNRKFVDKVLNPNQGAK